VDGSDVPQAVVSRCSESPVRSPRRRGTALPPGSKVNDEWLVERSRYMRLETIAPSAMIPLLRARSLLRSYTTPPGHDPVSRLEA
jgi:hypothetical protein